MKFENRCSKAKAKHAEGLFVISNTLASSILISLFGLPFSAVVAEIIRGQEAFSSFSIPSYKTLIIFTCLYAGALFVAHNLRSIAMDIMDKTESAD